MTPDVGSPDWILQKNQKLKILRTESHLQILPLEFGVDLDEDDRSFTLRIDSTGASLVQGITSTCEVHAKISTQTAEQISSGQISAAEAISEGNIKISGNIGILLRSSDLMAGLALALQDQTE